MTDTYQMVLWAIFSLCLLASGFLSGSETALTAVARERVQQLAATGRRGRRLEGLVDDLEGSIGTILVANNFVNILATSVATALAFQLVGETWGTILSTVVVTILVLVIGEVTPKTLAARFPERYGMTVAVAVWALAVGLKPIAGVFIGLGQGILRLLRLPARNDAGVTPADVRALAVLGERGGEIEPGEREIIERLFETADQPVRDVMTPRVDIVTLTLPVTSSDVREAVARTAHSRFPVVGEDGNPDSIQGLLYAKDVLSHSEELDSRRVSGLLRTPYYAPESASVMRVLEDLRVRRIGFAIVTDEYGGVDGLVTIKDLVGELVGELQDEYDPRVPTILPIGRQVWLADGRTPIDELEEATGAEVEDGPYSTVAGLFLSLSGNIPAEGDHVNYEGLRLTVLTMDRRRVSRIRVDATGSAHPPA
ncbi:MAG: hemolysin family protein [bacterium]|nr:hemolysin family protein [bacterium]MDE0351488.1 hemolysin family protein [bacterium]